MSTPQKSLMSSLLALGFLAPAVFAGDIDAPASPPEGASAVPSGFVAFSIESAYFASYAGTPDKPTQITKNLLSALGSLTTQPPVRLGGNTQDYTTYDESQSEAMTSTSDPRHYTLGPKYFDSLRALPVGTHYTFPFNNGEISDDVKSSNAAMAKLACAAIGNNLTYFEYGNEPDLYYSNGHRDSSFNVDQYVSEWKKGASSVAGAIKAACPDVPAKFLAPSLTGANGPNGFDAAKILDAGLNSDGLVGQISAHNYIEGANDAGEYDLLSHGRTDKKVQGLVTAKNNAKKAQGGSNLTFVLGETNSLYGGGKEGVSNAFQAALWTLDFSLLTASVGIERAYFHQASNSPYNAWNFGDDPAVKVPFYGNLATAKFFGKSLNVKVAEFGANGDNESAYGMYSNNKLMSVAILNMRHDEGSQSYSFDVSGASAAVIYRLAGKSATETDPSAVSFAGVSYSNDGTASGAFKTEAGKISNGKLSVDVKNAEAVIVKLTR